MKIKHVTIVIFSLISLSMAYSQSLYPFNNEAYKYGFMDSLGNVIIQAQYDDARSASTCGLYPVEVDNEFGAVNKEGEFVILPKYQTWIRFDDSCQLANVKSNYWWGFIDLQDNDVISFDYRHAYSFDESGLALVKDNNKWIFIDKEGNPAFAESYQQAIGFYKVNLAAVSVNDLWGFINKSGDFVIQPKYEDTHGFFEGGLAAVKYNGKWGFIDEEGKVIIKFMYDEVGAVNKEGEFIGFERKDLD